MEKEGEGRGRGHWAEAHCFLCLFKSSQAVPAVIFSCAVAASCGARERMTSVMGCVQLVVRLRAEASMYGAAMWTVSTSREDLPSSRRMSVAFQHVGSK